MSVCIGGAPAGFAPFRAGTRMAPLSFKGQHLWLRRFLLGWKGPALKITTPRLSFAWPDLQEEACLLAS